MITSGLKDYQLHTIRALREKFPELRGYFDHEIANCYSEYCDVNHAASWTLVDEKHFVEWATLSPLDNMKLTTRQQR